LRLVAYEGSGSIVVRVTGNMALRDRPLHALNRLAFGPRPGDLERVHTIGVSQFLHQQLNPDSIAEPAPLAQQIGEYRTLAMSPVDLFIEYQRPLMQARREFRAERGASKDALRSARIRQRIVMREAVEARLLRAIESPRQLQEVMTAFWFNHFNVFAGKGLDRIWTGAFEQQAIRPNALGRFRTLLGATAKHAAMLFYLDNWRNTAPGSPGARGKFDGINENYARELMELHTLGVNGGYTQRDVIALAHILTGWGFPRPGKAAARRGGFRELSIAPGGFYFDASRHDFSDKVLLGHRIKGGGEMEGEEALDLLARHPATANHISYQLAQYFIADDPPDAAVRRMAERFRQSGGDIRAVLETMLASAEFWDRRNFNAKFKTPYEYVISAVRATGAPVRNYRPLYGAMALLGMPPYGCQTPNGYANTRRAWLNPDAMMIRLSFATALGTGNLPLERAPFEEAIEKLGAAREPRGNRPAGDAGMKAIDTPKRRRRMIPPDPERLASTLAGYFTASTAGAIETSQPRLRAALMLGSPESMMR
jgi:uncharacterized protein (DUF1800 family)